MNIIRSCRGFLSAAAQSECAWEERRTEPYLVLGRVDHIITGKNLVIVLNCFFFLRRTSGASAGPTVIEIVIRYAALEYTLHFAYMRASGQGQGGSSATVKPGCVVKWWSLENFENFSITG